MKRYFLEKDAEICFSLEGVKEIMRIDGLTELQVYEAVTDRSVTGFFWCQHFHAMCEKGEGICGSVCSGYDPRNRISGCCKHYSTTFFEATGKVKVVRLTP